MKSIRAYDYVNHPYSRVKAALSRDAETIFREATQRAGDRMREVVSELHVNIGGIEVGTDVTIESQVLEDRPKSPGLSPILVLGLEWKSAHLPALFPVMHGKLSVYPLTPSETQLDFSGTYDKPLGVLGDAIDAVVGRRIAEASVDRFVKDIAAYLRKELGKEQVG
ncbi:MAG: hypothetical protein D6730_08060 [Bacteroidetes bacterium]|nr:MAG: hypothetical protein D6730_08060 [Bacteroidota bacterium]